MSHLLHSVVMEEDDLEEEREKARSEENEESTDKL